MPRAISSALATVTPKFGLQLAAGPRFGVGGAFERHFRLPYYLDDHLLETGIQALRAAADNVLAHRPACIRQEQDLV